LKKSLTSLIFILYPFLSAAENTLPTLIVTATRTAQTVDDSLASVTVITREDIDNSQALTLPDILRTVPGLDINSNGGLGKPISVFMRGTESDHVLVLVDGLKIGSATVGSVAFEHLPLSQIERIEIVRGPRSSLYGSEAIGGVIQIFTRQGKGIQASVGMGDDTTYHLTAGISGATKENWYSLSASHLQTEGFNDCQGNTSGGCFTIEPDDDGYDNSSSTAKLGHRFGDSLTIEAHAMRAQGHTEYDSSFDNEADFVQQIFGIKADYVASDQWQLNLSAGSSRDEIDNFGNNAPKSFFHTTRTMTTFQNNFLLPNENILIVGYDYQKDEVDSSTQYLVDSRDNQGVFAEYQTQWGGADLIVGIRNDDNEQFGDHTTGNIALAYALTPNTRLMLSYGTAFKAPTFNELYFPNFGTPKLDPEESESIEIGLMATHPDYQWSLNAYHTKIDKLIATNFDAATGDFFADNINKAKISGIDGALSWQKAGWEFKLKGSWLKPEDDVTGNLLPRRAQKTINVELAQRWKSARLGISSLAQSHRYDDAANNQRLGGYGILNLTAEYNFNKHWALRARVENVLDKEYETVRFYNTQGQFWFVSFHYQY